MFVSMFCVCICLTWTCTLYCGVTVCSCFKRGCWKKNKQTNRQEHVTTPQGIIVGRCSGYSYLTLGFQGNQWKCHFRTRQSGFDELFYLFDILKFNDYQIPRYVSRLSHALLSNSLSWNNYMIDYNIVAQANNSIYTKWLIDWQLWTMRSASINHELAPW